MTILSAQHISVSIGKKMICRDLSIQFRPGEIWGILGTNGSGKTTLLHTLAGLHAVDSGEIFLNQIALNAMSRKEIARSIGLLFQDSHFHFPQTIYDYCAAARFAHASYFHALSLHDKHCIDDALHVMSLSDMQHKSITELSGGEKRRVAIASVLTQTPAIYLLDEPTNHLDIRHQHETLSHFRDLAKQQNACIVMSIHDPRHAKEYCDHALLLLADGTYLQGASHDILTPSSFSQLYGEAFANRFNV